ncbi:hypothetical protein [Rubritalea tangerina]|uniref:hypothetical protein n=1 Tax=Rubritalea tangerina TaxID=430798 RepID=UPI00360A9697
MWLNDIFSRVDVYNNGLGELHKPKVFAIHSVVRNEVSQKVRVDWYSKVGRSYRIESSSNLKDWETVGSVLDVGLGQSFSYEHAVDAWSEKRFYRVVEISE